VSLSGDDADVLRRYWDKLSDGGTVTMRAMMGQGRPRDPDGEG
jgi:hypothetical protein